MDHEKERSVVELSDRLFEQLSQFHHLPTECTPVAVTARIRCTPDDFRVTEIPSYEPGGAGEHCYLWIEKRSLNTSDVIARLASRLNIAEHQIGTAGLKDRNAVTRQFFSVPARAFETAADPSDQDFQVLSAQRHSNKLKTGHLKGNHFMIVCRPKSDEFTPSELDAITAAVAAVATSGIANLFGSQRFGTRGSTIRDGLEILADTERARHGRFRNRSFRRLALNAVQAALFNLVVSQRALIGTLTTPVAGDIVIRAGGRKPFAWLAEQSPVDLIPAGPLFGSEMLAASDQALVTEMSVLTQWGLSPEQFHRRETAGDRRPMWVRPDLFRLVSVAPDAVTLELSLPPGSYATIALQHVFADVGDGDAV
ncbi:MAG: tRNA pseudouridine(13) synthase TruD [Planctomycetaceae bacterium]|nr:tRNA pseudouridine(13) synthase TruD [Planctomycetaceae bacterium]